MDIHPLLVALAVVVICALIYGAFVLVQMPIHPQLEKLAMVLVGLIVLACVAVWLIRMFGFSIPSRV